MEHLWSPVVETADNQSQIAKAHKRPNQAQTVAVGCARLPATFHGKEGVDGSSASEGSAKSPQIGFFLSDRLAQSPPGIRYGADYGAFRFGSQIRSGVS